MAVPWASLWMKRVTRKTCGSAERGKHTLSKSDAVADLDKVASSQIRNRAAGAYNRDEQPEDDGKEGAELHLEASGATIDRDDTCERGGELLHRGHLHSLRVASKAPMEYGHVKTKSHPRQRQKFSKLWPAAHLEHDGRRHLRRSAAAHSERRRNPRGERLGSGDEAQKDGKAAHQISI